MTNRIIIKTIEFATAALLIATIAEGGSWLALYLGPVRRGKPFD